MPTGWPRFAYACEFLLAVVTVFTLWSQVGGQGHLDLMAWYWKLALGGGLSAAIVCLTATLVREPRVISRGAILWVAIVVLIAAAMAAVTVYYHLHEGSDESDEESTTAMIAGRDGLST